MTSQHWARFIGMAALAVAGSAHAIGIVDAKGDWVSGYTGPTGGDLDVVGAYVTYNVKSDSFVFVATMDDDIGTTAGAFYVWGVDRGAGTARFAANGITGVLFDTVIVLNQNGSGAVNRLAGTDAGSTALAAGTAQSFGSTIVVTIAGSLLGSNGFDKTDYTWNIWPRAGAPLSGFAAISDFAPDNSNVLVTTVGAVPEPTTALLLAGGLAALALRSRRRPA